jgi:hypothetical protein
LCVSYKYSGKAKENPTKQRQIIYFVILTFFVIDWYIKKTRKVDADTVRSIAIIETECVPKKTSFQNPSIDH